MSTDPVSRGEQEIIILMTICEFGCEERGKGGRGEPTTACRTGTGFTLAVLALSLWSLSAVAQNSSTLPSRAERFIFFLLACHVIAVIVIVIGINVKLLYIFTKSNVA